MSYRRTPFAPGTWYHCFNRGIDKRTVFESKEDFERFEEMLYLANDTKRIERDTFYHLSHSDIMTLPRTTPLVHIAAYCLMPNHYHLLLHEITEGGITKFMHKVGTGYTSYFNYKNNRTGNLFVKPFRSKHISNDRYLRRVIQYIHLNPAELFEPQWKKGRIKNTQQLEKKLFDYSHSSLPDYIAIERLENNIIDQHERDFLKPALPSLLSLIAEAQAYYHELESAF